MGDVQLYLEGEKSQTGGEQIDEDTYVEYTLRRASFERNDSFFPDDSIFVPEVFRTQKDLYLTIVRHIQGDTFQTTCGNVCFTGCHDNLADAMTYKPSQDKQRYNWSGYFESFERLEIYHLNMQMNGVAQLIATKYEEE